MTEELKIGNGTTTEYALKGLENIEKGGKKLTILARGKKTSKALDVSEIIKSVLPPIETTLTSKTETFQSNGKEVRISSLKIRLLY